MARARSQQAAQRLQRTNGLVDAATRLKTGLAVEIVPSLTPVRLREAVQGATLPGGRQQQRPGHGAWSAT
jgi:hypothetical protein